MATVARWLKRAVTRTLHTVVSSRVFLLVVGLAAAWLAWATYYGYTSSELPGRNLLVVVLCAMAVCGLGAAVMHPTNATQTAIGVWMMAYAAIRGGFLYWANPDLSANPALPVHVVLFYVGLLIAVQARQGGGTVTGEHPETHTGERGHRPGPSRGRGSHRRRGPLFVPHQSHRPADRPVGVRRGMPWVREGGNR